jgi:Tol biopolymer transport system component
VSEGELAIRTDVDEGDRRLIVTFPDTDDLLLNPADDVTLTGRVAIGVTVAGSPPACALTTEPCEQQIGLLACIDQLFEDDGACGTTEEDTRFPSFTALPPPNDYQAGCFSEGPPCIATTNVVRAATDSEGNLLIPMGWGGVLVADDGVPVPRLVRARLASPIPFRVPSQTFLRSLTPEGAVLPPILEPQLDSSVAAPNLVTLFGSVDAPYTIIRIARRHGTCVDGAEADSLCETDLDCKGGRCVTSCVDTPSVACAVDRDCPSGACGRLFDFVPPVVGGPIELFRNVPRFCQRAPNAPCAASDDCPAVGDACVSYALEANLPVPLDGLVSSSGARSFTVRETIDGIDRNGDDDTNDSVTILRDRSTGLAKPLGPSPGCDLVGIPEGRASVRVSQFPFSFPAVAVEGDTLAFLESESGQSSCDEDGDADSIDSILRIFKLGLGETTVDASYAVDGSPRIDGTPLKVAAGRVYVRASEAEAGLHLTERQSDAFGGGQAVNGGEPRGVSGDGRRVVFVSTDSNLVSPSLVGQFTFNVYLRDRDTGTTTLISKGFNGEEADGDSRYASISRDGHWVAFESSATNLFPVVDGNGSDGDIFLYDVESGSVELVSRAFGGGFANNHSEAPAISDDGQVIVFFSYASDLLPTGEDTNGAEDVFAYDRASAATSRVSVYSDGTQGNGGLQNVDPGEGQGPVVSGNGRIVGFISSTPFDPDDAFGFSMDAYVHDRVTGATELISRTFDGSGEADDCLHIGGISADGRFVAFDSDSADLIAPGKDTNEGYDVFVRDRLLHLTERVSVGSDGSQGEGVFSGVLPTQAMSSDGRFVAFKSDNSGLVAGIAPDNNAEMYVHDRSTGTTRHVSATPEGMPGEDFTEESAFSPSDCAISADGQVVVFASRANDLIGPNEDSNDAFDVYVRAVDDADPLGVDARLFPDGRLDDIVLTIVDATTGGSTIECPAGDVSVAADTAVYLRPESSTGSANCPAGSLNIDEDLADDVVHLVRSGGPSQNLGLAATKVAASPRFVVALASEADQGLVDLNADGDAADDVVHVYNVDSGQWANLGQAAEAVATMDDRVAFVTPEGPNGKGSLNGDSDADDGVVQVYDAGAESLSNLGQAGEELVLGRRGPTTCGLRQLLAIRSLETAQSNRDANGDGDSVDGVLVVYDFVTDTMFDTGQAITPCRFATCEPGAPYRVNGSEVRFLTLETEQGMDLDGNGSIGGVVLQRFDLCTGLTFTISAIDPGSSSDPLDAVDGSQVFTATEGRCVQMDDDPCVGQSSCAEGTFCSRVTGLCTLQVPATCRTSDECSQGFVCRMQPVTVGTPLRDFDDDGVPDELDDCSRTFDPLQIDDDDDGVGNECDRDHCAAPGPGCVSTTSSTTSTTTSTEPTTLPRCTDRDCVSDDPCMESTCLPSVGCIESRLTGLDGALCVCRRKDPSSCESVRQPGFLRRGKRKACARLETPQKPQQLVRAVKKATGFWRSAGNRLARPKLQRKLGSNCAAALAADYLDARERFEHVSIGER